MANEAAILELHGTVEGGGMRFNCADELAIPKGTLLAFSGAGVKIVYPSPATGPTKFAGIANEEKVADDGATTIGAYTKCVADLLCSGSITLGAMAVLSGANAICAAVDTDYEDGFIVGKVLETGSNGATIAVAVGIY